jgi:DUF3040 family protein
MDMTSIQEVGAMTSQLRARRERCTVVDLTSEQCRRLDDLAGDLARDNPRLARALAGRRYARRRRNRARRRWRGRALDWVAISLLLAAMPLLIVGVVLARPELILIGAVAMPTGPALLTATQTQWPPAA